MCWQLKTGLSLDPFTQNSKMTTTTKTKTKKNKERKKWKEMKKKRYRSLCVFFLFNSHVLS